MAEPTGLESGLRFRVHTVSFTRSLKSDEKSEAQIFLDHFFRALGHGGVQEAGATLEFRIAKKPGSAQLELMKGEPAKNGKGGKKFAHLLWREQPGSVPFEVHPTLRGAASPLSIARFTI